MSKLVLGIVTAALLAGCDPPQPWAEQAGGVAIPACALPAGADTYDPRSGEGCLPKTTFQICGVPSGSVIFEDGTVTTPDGTRVTCAPACTVEEFTLSCFGPRVGPELPPSPPASLGCSVIPVPTAPGVVSHCCPCAPGATS
jgi:hypothetical protein